MKLFLLSQSVVSGYETYDSAVVAAESEEDARNIHPSKYVTHTRNGHWMGTDMLGKEYKSLCNHDWPKCSDTDQITVEYLGETNKERGVVWASFNGD